MNVFKFGLSNGLTLLVRPVKTVPKVTIQLWYRVGSKNEIDGERGIAHLIEHMIFKGTAGSDSLNLSESDINVFTHMFSGNCNAFTSHDYTGYLFNMPAQYWQQCLPVLADCMRNCAFKQDHLSSEFKAVIQELKMYGDNYLNVAFNELLEAVFAGHPYSYPIIGYKHDLWSITPEQLHAFYKKHYMPNNAVLVVVGDVDPDDVLKRVNDCFGLMPAGQIVHQKQVPFVPDIACKKITLYRDIQQPLMLEVCAGPGTMQAESQYLSVLAWILGYGKGARLYRRLVDELQLATSLSAIQAGLFEQDLIGLTIEPKCIENIPQIRQIIVDELENLSTHGLRPGELERAVKNARVRMYDTFDDIEQQAGEIGRYYLATGNAEYIFSYLQEPLEKIEQEVMHLIRKYLRPAVMHEGLVLPLAENEREIWVHLQEQSDEQDNEILSAHIRETPVEPPVYALTLTVQKSVSDFEFPKAIHDELPNELRVLYYHNDLTPKISLVLDLKMKHYYDPESLQGLNTFMNRMLIEGTRNYPGTALADALEMRGMSFAAYPGGMVLSMLKDDFEYGLRLLKEILTCATFDEEKIEKVRGQILADIKGVWDEPTIFARQLIKERIYQGHPYSKNILGTEASIKAITRDDLLDLYKKYSTPRESILAVVGDLGHYDVQTIIEKNLSGWVGPDVPDMDFPLLKPCGHETINYQINRDQVVLCYAAFSVSRKDPDFDKLFIFDQVFGGGVLGSMSSRLFQLREQSGLFYTINGSLAVNANEQPGMVLIQTIVSLDRLQEAEKAIEKLIQEAVDSVLPSEIEEAKRAIVYSLVNNFESNYDIARTFVFLEYYGLPATYFDHRAQTLNPIDLEEVKQAAKKYLFLDRLMKLRIGRLS